MEGKKKTNPPCWRLGMAQMAIRVSGQRQKHRASLADEIANWLWLFSGYPLPPPSSSRTLVRSCSCHRRCYHRHRAVGRHRHRRCSRVAAAAATASSVATFSRLCELYVSTAVTVATAATIVVVVAPAAVTVAVIDAAITVDAAGNPVGGGGGAELIGLALSCTTHRVSGGCPNLRIRKFGGSI